MKAGIPHIYSIMLLVPESASAIILEKIAGQSNDRRYFDSTTENDKYWLTFDITIHLTIREAMEPDTVRKMVIKEAKETLNDFCGPMIMNAFGLSKAVESIDSLLYTLKEERIPQSPADRACGKDD